MWIYSQSKGTLYHDLEFVGVGYSGRGEGKDNPALQNVRMKGPLPQGHYRIGIAFTHPQTGPLSMRLTPDPKNQMFGRSAFLIHGDSPSHPGQASEGCIILDGHIRKEIAKSPDKELTVVA